MLLLRFNLIIHYGLLIMKNDIQDLVTSNASIHIILYE